MIFARPLIRRVLYAAAAVAILLFVLIALPNSCAYQRDKAVRAWLSNPLERGDSTLVRVRLTSSAGRSAVCEDPDALHCLTLLVRRSRGGDFHRLPNSLDYDIALKLADGREINCFAEVTADCIKLTKPDPDYAVSFNALDLPLPPDAPPKLRDMCRFLSDPASKGSPHF